MIDKHNFIRVMGNEEGNKATSVVPPSVRATTNTMLINDFLIQVVPRQSSANINKENFQFITSHTLFQKHSFWSGSGLIST